MHRSKWRGANQGELPFSGLFLRLAMLSCVYSKIQAREREEHNLALLFGWQGSRQLSHQCFLLGFALTGSWNQKQGPESKHRYSIQDMEKPNSLAKHLPLNYF